VTCEAVNVTGFFMFAYFRVIFFGEILSVKKDVSTTLQHLKTYVLLLIDEAGFTSYIFERDHPVV